MCLNLSFTSKHSDHCAKCLKYTYCYLQSLPPPAGCRRYSAEWFAALHAETLEYITRWNIGIHYTLEHWNIKRVEWFAALHAETLEYIARWIIRCITRWNIGIHYTLKHWKTFEWFAALHAETLEDIALNDSLHYTLKH